MINYSMSWTFDGPGDGTSPDSVSPLKTVDYAVSQGIVWVNSAGNSGEQTWFTSNPSFLRYGYTNLIRFDALDIRERCFHAAELVASVPAKVGR